MIERAVLPAFQIRCFDRPDRRRLGWHKRLLAVFGRMDLRSLDGWKGNPPVQEEAPLIANPWMRGRFQA